MDQGFKDLVTVAIASWGAVTGSTAIALQLRQFRRDRAHLNVSAQLKFDNTMPPRPSVEITVTNRGRRPATTSKAWVQLRPIHWWGKLPWRAQKNRVALARLKSCDLPESHSVTLGVYETEIPKEIDLAQAQAIIVEDSVGNMWRSKGINGQSELARRQNLTPLKTQKLSTNERHAAFAVYLFAENACTIQIDYGDGTSNRRHSIHCGGQEQMEELYEIFTRKAENFVNGNAYEI